MLFLIATLAIAGAAVGPIFLSSSDTSVLATTLSTAPAGNADILFLTAGPTSIVSEINDAAKTANTASHDLLGKPIFVADLGTGYLKHRIIFVEDLLWRTDICRHLRIIEGVCATKNGTVSLSARSASALGDRVGDRIHLSLANNPKRTWVKVVGIYQQPPSANTPYWRGINYFQYGSGSTVGTNAGANAGAIASIVLDPLVTTRSTVFAASASNVQVQYSADVPWRPQAWVIGKSALQGALARVEHSLSKTYQLQVETLLPSIIATAQHNVNLMSAIVLAIVLQLVLLALIVLYGLGRSTATGRRVEADFARRRGFTRAGLLSLAVSEPAALIGAALPVGILVAWGAMRIFGDAYLYRGVSVDVTGLSIAAGFAAFVAAIFATALASYGLWRHASGETRRRAGTTAVMVDAFGVALGVAGLLALATKGALNGTHANPLAAAAPGLLAIGGAVLGLRLMALLARGFVRSSHASPRVAWFLAIRQIGRRPDVLRRLFPLAAATSVVMFAVGSYALASVNRSRVADFVTGAYRVVDVTPPLGANFLADVRAADPSGKQAMAVAYDYAENGELLAVDSKRFARIASWPSGLTQQSAASVIRRVEVKLPPAVTFTGANLKMTLDMPNATPAILAAVDVLNESYIGQYFQYFGPLERGTHTYVIPLQGDCVEACRLVGLDFSYQNSNAYGEHNVMIRLDSVAIDAPRTAWKPVAFGARIRDSWAPASAGVSVKSFADGVPGVVFKIPPEYLISGVAASPAFLPAALPAFETAQLGSVNPPSASGEFPYEGLDGGSVTLRNVVTVPALPEIGRDGALVDLNLAQLAETQQPVFTSYQVWLTRSAKPTVLEHLRHEGFQIGASSYASQRLAALNHTGLALAYDLSLIATPIAVLLAAGAVIFAIAAEGRRRRHSISSLGAVGLPRGVIRRSLMFENATLLIAALVVGGAIGFAADALALSSLPEFSGGTNGLPLETGLPYVALLIALGVLAAVLVVSAAVSSRLIVRQAFTGESIEQR
jgi:putative ABC transport system permease protein